jgi:hypothetical protein
VLTESVHYERSDLRAQDILAPDLEDAGTGSTGQRQDPREVEIVAEDDETALACPAQDRGVARPWISDLRPVSGLVAVILKQLHPTGGEVDVDDQLHSPAANRDLSLLDPPGGVGKR